MTRRGRKKITLPLKKPPGPSFVRIFLARSRGPLYILLVGDCVCRRTLILKGSEKEKNGGSERVKWLSSENLSPTSDLAYFE